MSTRSASNLPSEARIPSDWRAARPREYWRQSMFMRSGYLLLWGHGQVKRLLQVCRCTGQEVVEVIETSRETSNQNQDCIWQQQKTEPQSHVYQPKECGGESWNEHSMLAQNTFSKGTSKRLRSERQFFRQVFRLTVRSVLMPSKKKHSKKEASRRVKVFERFLKYKMIICLNKAKMLKQGREQREDLESTNSTVKGLLEIGTTKRSHHKGYPHGKKHKKLPQIYTQFCLKGKSTAVHQPGENCSLQCMILNKWILHHNPVKSTCSN